MRISDELLENIILITIIILSLIIGWIFSPLIIENVFLKWTFFIVSISAALSYLIFFITFKIKSELYLHLSISVALFILVIPFKTIYSNLTYLNNNVLSILIFQILPLLLNTLVVVHYIFKEYTNKIENTIEFTLLVILAMGILKGGFGIWQLINHSVEPPLKDVSMIRKIFFISRIGYFLLLGYLGYYFNKRNKLKTNINIHFASLIIFLFIVYSSVSFYLLLTTDYYNSDSFILLNEFLVYLLASFLLIISLRVINFKDKYKLKGQIIKVFNYTIYGSIAVMVIPWLYLGLMKKISVIQRVLNMTPDSLILIMVSSVGISLISNLILYYYTNKERKK